MGTRSLGCVGLILLAGCGEDGAITPDAGPTDDAMVLADGGSVLDTGLSGDGSFLPRDAGPDLVVTDDGSTSGTLEAGARMASLRVQTNLPAECRYGTEPEWGFDILPDALVTTSGLAHTAQIAVQQSQSYQFYIRCRTDDGRYTKDALSVSFSVADPVQELVVAASGGTGLLTVWGERWQTRLFEQVLLCAGNYSDNGHNDPLWRGVGVGGNRIVAAGGGFYEGYFQTSLDGEQWTERSIFVDPMPVPWVGDVTYGNNLWVAVTGNLGRIWSTDGVTWSGGAYQDPHPGDPDVAHRGVAYGGGRFVGVGNVGGAYHAFSSDGAQWTPIYTDGHPEARSWEEAAYGAGGFVLRHGAEYDSNAQAWLPGLLAFIPDGVDTPTVHTVVGPTSGIAFGNGWFTAPGIGQSAFVSPDGMNWTEPCYTCCVGAECASLNTPDGASGDCSAMTYECGGVPTQVAFGGGRFYSIGNQSGQTFMYTSADGINWVQENSLPYPLSFRDLDVGFVTRPPLPSQDRPATACDPNEDGDDRN